jgi:hypothetical protein
VSFPCILGKRPAVLGVFYLWIGSDFVLSCYLYINLHRRTYLEIIDVYIQGVGNDLTPIVLFWKFSTAVHPWGKLYFIGQAGRLLFQVVNLNA